MGTRRTPRSGPGGSRRPGRSSAARARLTPGGVRHGEQRPPRRLTGRAAILVLVVAVLAVSYASSMRAYLEQRSHIADLKTQISDSREDIAALEREKRRWQDDAFVQARARERFGYLMPGETAYQVLDEDGEPLEARPDLEDPSDVARPEPTAWWDTAWESVEVAADPPPPEERSPRRRITPPPRDRDGG